MNKNCFALYLITLISILSLTTSITKLNNTGGIKEIKFHNNETEEISESFLSFLIPLGTPIGSITLNLNLLEPKNSDGNQCTAECPYSDNALNCKILESECDSIGEDSKVIIDRIVEYNDYQFENPDSLASYISFRTTSIEMTCSNFKLSFFLFYGNVQNHPYENLNFSIPFHYKEKKGEAKCILPKKSEYIPCIIDAGNTLFQKDNFIEFETNKQIAINKDLDLNINIEKYRLEDDCGKDTSSSNYIYKLSFIKIINILLLIYFMI